MNIADYLFGAISLTAFAAHLLIRANLARVNQGGLRNSLAKRNFLILLVALVTMAFQVAHSLGH